jgi:hypothetical protein
VKERIVPLLQWAAMVVWDPSLYSVKVLIQSAVPEPFYCFEREREGDVMSRAMGKCSTVNYSKAGKIGDISKRVGAKTGVSWGHA